VSFYDIVEEKKTKQIYFQIISYTRKANKINIII